jgi:DNA-3-methyladenine glycosylase
MKRDNFTWLDVPAEVAARRLLGCELVREVDGQEVRVRIVETEAYDQADEASHTFRGRTQRNDAMFKSAGNLYVYFTYGMHHCCNVVCGPEGFGSGVLIRAVEPLEGIDIIERRRGVAGVNATNGPGKVCQALDIDRQLSGHDLAESPMRLIKRPALPDDVITVGPRIGISKAVHELRRFYIAGNRYVSKASFRLAR